MMLINRISKDYINSLEPIYFPGHIQVVKSSEHAAIIAKKLKLENLLGFDTESRPSFKKGILYPISIVQLATSKTAFLFQIKKTGFIKPLIDILEDGNIKKIAIGFDGDLEKLNNLKRIAPSGFIDLSEIAVEKGIIQSGGRALTARYLNRRLVKSSRTTNWAIPELSKNQKIYAATDAWICLELYPLLLADNINYKEFDEENSAN